MEGARHSQLGCQGPAQEQLQPQSVAIITVGVNSLYLSSFLHCLELTASSGPPCHTSNNIQTINQERCYGHPFPKQCQQFVRNWGLHQQLRPGFAKRKPCYRLIHYSVLAIKTKQNKQKNRSAALGRNISLNGCRRCISYMSFPNTTQSISSSFLWQQQPFSEGSLSLHS